MNTFSMNDIRALSFVTPLDNSQKQAVVGGEEGTTGTIIIPFRVKDCNTSSGGFLTVQRVATTRIRPTESWFYHPKGNIIKTEPVRCDKA